MVAALDKGSTTLLRVTSLLGVGFKEVSLLGLVNLPGYAAFLGVLVYALRVRAVGDFDW